MLPKDHPHSVTLQRDELRGAIERVAQFSDERSRAIRVQRRRRRSEVHSSLSETGESEESIPVEYDGTAGRDRIQRAVPARFSAGGRRPIKWRSMFKDPHSAGELRPGGEKARQLPLRDHADADLMR